MAGFDNETVYADNVDFSGGSPVTGKVTTNGQLLIGATASPNIRVGSLTSTGNTLSITTGAGTINLETNGSTVGNTITGDSGGSLSPTAGNWNVLGQQASTVAVMDTVGSVSTLRIEDRSWNSQYIVDSSSTIGLRGTFTTVQAAVTQAVADGATGTNTKNIIIRSASITGNIAFPNDCALNIVGAGASLESGIGSIIFGNITFGTSCIVNFSNVTIVAGSGVTVTVPTVDSVTFIDCFLNQSGGGTALSLTGSTSNIFLHNCYIASALLQDTTTTTPSDLAKFYNCVVVGQTSLSSSGSAGFKFFQCTLGNVVYANNGSAEFIDCYFTNAGITGTSGATQSKLYGNKFITSAGSSDPFVQATATFWTANNVADGAGLLYSSSPTILKRFSEKGNLIKATRTAVSYVVLVTDEYIGVTSTAAARTITLPSAAINTDQVFTIKDESGGAATNNITVTVNGGVKTIDGVTSFAINTNYGAITVIYDGTNYFIY